MMSKLVGAVNLISTCTYMIIKGQGHSLTLVQIFHVEPSRDREMKVCSNGQSHMIKI